MPKTVTALLALLLALLVVGGVAAASSGPAVDLTAPVVSVAMPAGRDPVSGGTTLSADASDAASATARPERVSGVRSVRFEIDGAAVGRTDGTPPYDISWDSRSVADGVHTVTAVATDAAGNSTMSTSFIFAVSNRSSRRTSSRPPESTLLPKYGMSADCCNFTRPPADQQAELGFYRDLHAGIVRHICGNPAGGNDLGFAYMQRMVAGGMVPSCLVIGTLEYGSRTAAQVGSECGAAAARFSGTVLIEPANEIDLSGWVGHGGEWADFQRQCYVSAKAENPNAIVLFPGMFEGPSGTYALVDFVRDFYAAGGGDYYEMMNVHLYEDPICCHGSRSVWDQTFGYAGGPYETYNVRQQMDANGDSEKPIVSTESGASSSQVGESVQNERVSRTLSAVDGVGTGDRKLKFALIFTLFDDGPVCCREFGLLREDRSHKPAYDSFKRIAAG